MENKNSKELLKNIIECTNVNDVLSNKPSKCTAIVKYQLNFLKERNKLEISRNGKLLAVPEPWSGDILNAKIMFLSSNPSISIADFEADKYPLHYVNKQNHLLFNKEKKCYDFFTNRFQKEIYTTNEEFRAVPFWRTIEDWYMCLTSKKNPKEIISKINKYRGEDFVITELVHCKSKSEKGVEDAIDTCFDKWFKDVIQICNAKIIIILGATCRNKILKWLYSEKRNVVNRRGNYIGPYPEQYNLFNKNIQIIFFPHPSAHYGSTKLQSFIQRAYENSFYGKENKERYFDLRKLQTCIQNILNID